jgi:hypothetical protein
MRIDRRSRLATNDRISREDVEPMIGSGQEPAIICLLLHGCHVAGGDRTLKADPPRAENPVGIRARAAARHHITLDALPDAVNVRG